jgi:hypothetical protein
MAKIIELHSTVVPFHYFAPPLIRTSTFVKNSSLNPLPEKKEPVERLWKEMEGGGWVKDTHLIDLFPQPNPTFKGESSVPKSVKIVAQLCQPLVKCFNVLAAKNSSLAFVDLSMIYPRKSHDSSHVNNQPISNLGNNDNTLELRPGILGMHKCDVNALLEARQESGNVWLYWKLVRVFCEVKISHSPADWMEG